MLDQSCYTYDMAKKRKSSDINILAKQITEEATQGEEKFIKEKNPAAVALGRLGGLKGGVARAKKLTPKQRSQIAQKAAQIRWQREAKKTDE
jgi:hypothetical protein